ncbi:MAG: RNA-directed DNA polymerase [Ruminococcus flavefaciens]|nr:RNA-directed DNA polymerase [Ruminococcus flavefaciens]
MLNDEHRFTNVHTFKVFEPKEREIIASEFEDKIVLDLLAKRVLKPLISPIVIFDNYASQDGKGTHAAVRRLERYTMKYAKSVGWTNRGWVYTYDIKKFFYMIDQAICKQMVDRLDMDDILRRMIYRTIEICTPDLNPYTSEEGKGLCIGFHTSQWLSVLYLNGLDHFIKEKLHIKYYGRYADDFYIIHEDREYLEYCNEQISKYLNERLLLTLNHKSHIHPFSQGVCFLGYHVTYNPHDHQVYTTIRSKSIDKMKRRLRRQVRDIHSGMMTLEHAYASLESWYSYARHGKSDAAMNAYEDAKRQLDALAKMYDEARQIRQDWDLTDTDGFILLQPNTPYIYNMSNGHFNLQQKMTRHLAEQYIGRIDYEMNPNLYIDRNMHALLYPEQYLPPIETKRTIFTEKMHGMGYRFDATNV